MEAQRVASLLLRAELRGDVDASVRLASELAALASVLKRPQTVMPQLRDDCARAADAEESRWGPQLFAGDAPALWDGLRPRFNEAVEIDVVVAYLTVGGLKLVEQTLRRALDAQCRLRLLAGCYLGGTRPDALRALHALTAGYENARVRFVEDPMRHFHPKVYRVVSRGGAVNLFVGSSNLSRDALTGRNDSVEWNLCLDDASAPALLDDARGRIDALFAVEGAPLDEAMIARWEKNAQRFLPPALILDSEEPWTPVEPNAAQREALARLAELRAEGATRALVVAPTGVGKTILAALDAAAVLGQGKGRVLFVAHRLELLTQAQRSFERVRGDGWTHGFVHQSEKSTQADHVYASVWSLDALDDATLARFEYVVIDEAHHGASKSYRKLLARVRRAFVLGLTATPERLDGVSIYPLFDGVVAWEATLLQAIAKHWLVPFHYFGVPDPVDYKQLEWKGGSLGYDAAELERALLSDARIARVLEALADPKHSATRSLVFCVTIAHAEHMAAALRGAKLRVACVHSGPKATPRATAIRELEAGRLDAIVAVDVFNEGVDVPSLDRVVLLRPTDSPTVFLQQIGRGLRLHPGKKALTVLDLVGNHRRASVHLGLLGLGDDEITKAKPGETFHRAWSDGREVSLSPEAIDAVKALQKAIGGPRERLLTVTRELCEGGSRPTLAEVVAQTGVSPSTITRLFASWLGLLGEAGVRSEDDEQLAASPAASKLLSEVESTDMSGAHKMILLGAMAERGLATVTVKDGAGIFWEHLETNHPAARRFFVDAESGLYNGRFRAPSNIPRKYPMEVLAKKADLFVLRGDTFTMRLPGDLSPGIVFAAINERAEARLYWYCRSRSSDGEVIADVVKNGKGVCLMLGKSGARYLGADGETITLVHGASRYEGLVRSVAINVIRHPGDKENIAAKVIVAVTESRDVSDAATNGSTVRLRRNGAMEWEMESA